MSIWNRIINFGLRSKDGWVQVIGDSKTASGVTITPSTSLTIPTVFQAVTVISGDVAQLPFELYRRDDDDNRTRAKEHPAYSLLKRKPNRYMTALQFKMVMQCHVLLWGNGYAHIQRDSLGRPIALWPLLPSVTKPIMDDQGRLMYETEIGAEGQRKKKTYRASNVLHIRGLGFDGITGHSVVSLARDSWGMSKAAEKHGGNYFKNFATPQGILSLPGSKLTPEMAEQTKKDWKTLNSNDNDHDIAVLAGGMTFQPLSMSNKDSQFLESRQFQRTEIASWFNLPPHKVNDLSRATFSNIEEQSRDYLNTSLMRWLVTWQEEVDTKLLSDSEYEQGEVYSEFNVNAFLRGDIKSRYEAYATGVTNGWLNRNEVRRMENLNSVDGLDEYLVPLNMGNSGEDQNHNEPAKVDGSQDEETPEDALRDMIHGAIEGVVRMEFNRIRESAKTTKNYLNMVQGFYKNYESKLWDVLRPLGAAKTTCTDYIKTHLGIWERIADEAKPSDLMVHVDAFYAEWPEAVDVLTEQIMRDRSNAQSNEADAAA